MALFLGLDVGTQGVKALVYDGSSRKVVGRGAQPWSILETTVPGRAEQHPATWVEVCSLTCSVAGHTTHSTVCIVTNCQHLNILQGTIKAAKQALSQVDASRVRGVGVSGQQHGMVVLDVQDKVLRPAKVGADACQQEQKPPVRHTHNASSLLSDCVRWAGRSSQQHATTHHHVAAACSDVVCVRPDSRLLQLWCDTESAPEAAELSKALGYTVVSR
jgi:sugar (pentulose or hexulose) kinase